MQSMIDAFNDPAMRHAALVHFPVALAMLGVPVALISAIRLGRGRAWRWAAFAVYGVLLVAALLAMNSGEGAEEALTVALADETYEVLETHEEMGEKVWMFAATTLALAALTFVDRKRLQGVAAGLTFIGAVAGAGWTGMTAHHGGTLVYDGGVGTPAGEDEGGANGPDARDVDARAAFFAEAVRPLLEARCWRCHNPSKRKARLDQTSIAGLLEGGISGPALVPGRPGESLMIELITEEDEDYRMPPEGDPLTEAEIEAVTQWIRGGAVWSGGAGRAPTE